jgi:hypothetical protein
MSKEQFEQLIIVVIITTIIGYFVHRELDKHFTAK